MLHALVAASAVLLLAPVAAIAVLGVAILALGKRPRAHRLRDWGRMLPPATAAMFAGLVGLAANAAIFDPAVHAFGASARGVVERAWTSQGAAHADGSAETERNVAHRFDAPDAEGRIRTFHDEDDANMDLCGHVHAGSVVTVRYAPSDPSLSSLEADVHWL